ncbi:MAG TPA: UPF0175 family protein [Bryobacterales bacterium]|nr:UPF0175 family protein [Bryobacterales bacterium]
MKRVNTTMPQSLLQKVDLYSQLNLEDRATAIRQLVAEGLRVRLEQTVLEKYRRGKITIRQGAELLGVSYLEMDEMLRENHIPLVSDISLALPSQPGQTTRQPRKPPRRKRR